MGTDRNKGNQERADGNEADDPPRSGLFFVRVRRDEEETGV